MKTHMLTLLTIAAVPLCAQARPIGVWTYKELLEKSDLVVIAKVESVADFDGNVEVAPFAEFLTPQVTKFNVEGVLRGEHQAETLELVHCRFRNEQIPPNGPLLARFESEGRKMRIESGANEGTLVQEGRPSYLLFLKRREDGRFEPVAGQVDSELSVRRVTSAFGL